MANIGPTLSKYTGAAELSALLESDKFGIVSVKTYGAKGDGVTDDTKSIQNAIEAISSSGGVVYFPSGNYLVSASLVVSYPNIKLLGAGASASTIKSNSASFWIIKYTSNSSRMTVDGLSVEGSAINSTTNQYAIGYSNTTSDSPENITIKNCKFSLVNNGITTASGKYWTISENIFENLIGVVSGTGYGILAAGNTSYCIFDRNKFFGDTNKGRHAIYMSNGCSYCIASNNEIKSFNETAIISRADAGQPGTISNVIVSNIISFGGNSSTNESAAIYIGGVSKKNTVDNNTIIDFDNISIVVLDGGHGGECLNNTISNNKIIGSGFSGIQVIGAKYTNIISNYIYNASRLSVGIYRGILITSSGTWGTTVAENTQVIGNVVMGTNQRCALTINASAPVPINNHISNNIFFSGDTAGKPVELNVSSVDSKYIYNLDDSEYLAGGNDSIIRQLSRCRSIDFGSINANTTKESTFTVNGLATSGWTIVATPEVAPATGISWCGYVSAANTVTVRISNATTGSVSVGAINWRIDAFNHNGSVS